MKLVTYLISYSPTFFNQPFYNPFHIYEHFIGYVCNGMNAEKYCYPLVFLSPSHLSHIRFLVSPIGLGSRILN